MWPTGFHGAVLVERAGPADLTRTETEPKRANCRTTLSFGQDFCRRLSQLGTEVLTDPIVESERAQAESLRCLTRQVVYALQQARRDDGMVRVVVSYGEFAWYHEGFLYTQETPFSFASAADFSCGPNRGRSDSPLFQVNHFITPALGGNGAINNLDVLLPRLEQCQMERSHLPNLVAVDFYEAGDVMAAIDAINGFGSE